MPIATSHARGLRARLFSRVAPAGLRSGLALIVVALATHAAAAAPLDGDVEAEGPIEALGASSVTVDGRTFAVTAQTRIYDHDERPLVFADLRVGLDVDVEGHTAANGTVVADEIEVEERRGDGGNGEVEAEGLVTARADSSLTVGGLTFRVTPRTVIKGDRRLTFADIVVGLRVEVEGRLLAGNRLVATEIKVERENGEERHVEVEGLVTRLRGDSLVVAGTAFRLTPATVFVGDDERRVPRAALAVGQRVEVYGRYAAGVLVAVRVEIEEYRAGEIEVTGTIEALGAARLTVAGTEYAVTSQTVILGDGRTPIPFSALVLGQVVEVRSVLGAGGARVATHIKVEDRRAYGREIEVRAALDAVGNGAVVVLGRPFVVLASTQIVGLRGATGVLADFPLGQPVEVYARRDPDGRLVALRIERQEGPAANVRLRAAVTAVRTGALDVLGVPFAAAAAIVVRADGTPGTLASVAVGQEVLVTGIRGAAGGFTATRIEIRRTAHAAGRIGRTRAGGFALPGLDVATTSATLFVSEAGAPVAPASVTEGADVQAFGTATGAGTMDATRVVVLGRSTAVSAGESSLGEGFAVEDVFPNPTLRTATVRYALGAASIVRLTLVDALGRTVLTVADGPVAAGVHEARLDARGLPAGLYVVRLSVDGRPAGARPVTVVR